MHTTRRERAGKSGIINTKLVKIAYLNVTDVKNNKWKPQNLVDWLLGGNLHIVITHPHQGMPQTVEHNSKSASDHFHQLQNCWELTQMFLRLRFQHSKTMLNYWTPSNPLFQGKIFDAAAWSSLHDYHLHRCHPVLQTKHSVYLYLLLYDWIRLDYVFTMDIINGIDYLLIYPLDLIIDLIYL